MRLVALIILGMLLAGCSGGGSAPPSGPPAGSCCGWEPQFSTGVVLKPATQGFEFAFPVKPNSIHYLVAPQGGGLALNPGQVITADYEITGSNPVFEYTPEPTNTCGGPANVRLFIQEQGDNLGGQGPYAYYRWWATNPLTLLIGTFSLSEALQPGSWSSIYGEKGDASAAAIAGFQQAISHIGNIGMTFGGGCFAGHGADLASGSATFNVRSFTWQ